LNSPTPLVSITIPTGNRRIFLRQALRYASRQTWPKLEIVVVDGGRDPAHFTGPLSRYGAFVRYERVDPSTTLGWRRNRAAELARGEIIVHFDDDDWHSRDRVARQVRTLLDGADITQTSDFFAWSIPLGRAREWPYRGGEDFAHGASMAYWRRLWEREPFADVGTPTPAGRVHTSPVECNRNEDSSWCQWWRSRGARVVDSLDSSLFVYMLHARMTMGFTLHSPPDEVSTLAVRAVLGQDAVFYDELAEILPPPQAPSPLSRPFWR
jgi:glycosyltransferase involved in cell wall biosynthesis